MQKMEARVPAAASRDGPSTFLAAVVILVVVTSGLLFGYDQGVISGALRSIRAEFSLSALLIEVVTSWVTLGALFGSLVAGEVADRIGRKRAALAAGVLFVIGAFIQAFAPGTLVLVAGRFVVGVGVGVAAVAAPLYASEMAPAAWRGRLVSAYQLAITIGIFLAYLINGALAAGPNWRLMLGLSAIPGILLVIFALRAPESPRWLVKKGRFVDAERILQRMLGKDDCRAELKEIDQALKSESRGASWLEVFDPAYRRPLVIGLGLAVFQQITGINAIIYYAGSIFASAGFASPEAQALATTWAVGATNVVATLIAIAFIDKIGRVPLLLAGLIGMGVSLAAVGFALHFMVRPGGEGYGSIITVIALIIFIASFAFSLGPVVWTVINEIFPSRIRGRGVAVATAVNWGSAFLVSQFFLTLTEEFGEARTFWLFGIFCVIGWVWIYRAVPETKGRSLEEIEQLWRKP